MRAFQREAANVIQRSRLPPHSAILGARVEENVDVEQCGRLANLPAIRACCIAWRNVPREQVTELTLLASVSCLETMGWVITGYYTHRNTRSDLTPLLIET